MMQIGFIGLGKMGMEMAVRAINDGHKLIGYDWILASAAVYQVPKTAVECLSTAAPYALIS